MTKEKISATIDPDRLATAKSLTGETNVSAILDQALVALIDLERERRWLDAHPASTGADSDAIEVVPDLVDIPWHQ